MAERFEVTNHPTYSEEEEMRPSVPRASNDYCEKLYTDIFRAINLPAMSAKARI